MMISTPHLTETATCSCGSDTCCQAGALERPRYFPRQIVTATELTLEHDYQRDRARRHNRMLHGWGVVCGAEVCQVAGPDGAAVPWKVAIKPGYVLGSCGDEIVIDCERIVDLRTNGLMCMSGVQAGEVSDPWCSDDRTERAGTVCVAIKYREFMARPVRSHPVGCGCDGAECEYSRWRDGYEVGLLPDCPDSPRPMREVSNVPTLGARGTVGSHDPVRELASIGKLTVLAENFGHLDCPECPTDPWVVLACVEVDGNGRVSDIDNCKCRRLVVSAARFSWRCRDESTPVRNIDTIADPHAEAAVAYPAGPATASEPASPAPAPVTAAREPVAPRAPVAPPEPAVSPTRRRRRSDAPAETPAPPGIRRPPTRRSPRNN
jgi:hypothetical protein